MKNYVQPGNSITIPAPAGGVVSGVPVIIGSLAGVPNATAAATENVTIDLTGVFDVDKATGQAWAVGNKLYWDNAAKKATTTVGANVVFAVAIADALSGDTVGRIRLGAPVV